MMKGRQGKMMSKERQSQSQRQITVQSARSMSVSKIGVKIQYIVKFEHFKSTECTVDKKKKKLMCTDMKELYANSMHQVFTYLFPDSNR